MSIRFSNPLRPRAMLAAMASLASTVCAAGAAPVAVAPKSGELVNVPQVMLSLVLVLGALFALAWFARRLRGFRRGNGPQITVLSELVLGPKERALLLQVEGCRILVGVGVGQVSALHVLPPESFAVPAASVPADATEGGAAAAGTPPSFRALLLKGLGR